MSMKENLCMQSASLNLSVYPSLVSSVIGSYRNLNSSGSLICPPYATSIHSSDKKKSLRIGWITGDICYHPVARFMLSLFYDTVPKNHSHTVIDCFAHGAESKKDWFKKLEHTSFDLGSTSFQIKFLRYVIINLMLLLI